MARTLSACWNGGPPELLVLGPPAGAAGACKETDGEKDRVVLRTMLSIPTAAARS